MEYETIDNVCLRHFVTARYSCTRQFENIHIYQHCKRYHKIKNWKAKKAVPLFYNSTQET